MIRRTLRSKYLSSLPSGYLQTRHIKPLRYTQMRFISFPNFWPFSSTEDVTNQAEHKTADQNSAGSQNSANGSENNTFNSSNSTQLPEPTVKGVYFDREDANRLEITQELLTEKMKTFSKKMAYRYYRQTFYILYITLKSKFEEYQEYIILLTIFLFL